MSYDISYSELETDEERRKFIERLNRKGKREIKKELNQMTTPTPKDIREEKGKNFSTNNTGNRKKSDFYETPYSLTRLLLKKERLIGAILEPAVGGGAIGRVLNEFQYSYIGYDIENDFLKQTQKYDTIITNPPYSLSQKFILKAKENARKKVIFLLPLSYLHGKKRYDEIWIDKDFPLARVYVFTRYPLLGEGLRQDGKHNTGMMVYAWYVWEKGYKGEPTIKWLDNNEFILSFNRKTF